MPDFSSLFKGIYPKRIEYKDQTVILVDHFPVQNGDILILNIESTQSDHLQGFCINVTGWTRSVETGEIFKVGKGVKMLYWEDTLPKNAQIQIFTKQNFVWVANIWETIDSNSGAASVNYFQHGAAMIFEEIENGRRYRCNDFRPDEDFDDIIFTVQKLVPPDL